jgi:hypothetical protein
LKPDAVPCYMFAFNMFKHPSVERVAFDRRYCCLC